MTLQSSVQYKTKQVIFTVLQPNIRCGQRPLLQIICPHWEAFCMYTPTSNHVNPTPMQHNTTIEQSSPFNMPIELELTTLTPEVLIHPILWILFIVEDCLKWNLPFSLITQKCGRCYTYYTGIYVSCAYQPLWMNEISWINDVIIKLIISSDFLPPTL